MAILKINGRPKFFERSISITQIAPSKYVVETENHGAFRIEGGHHLGGARNEWFLEGPLVNGYIECCSVIDALELIDHL